jgi:hypothetical protein
MWMRAASLNPDAGGQAYVASTAPITLAARTSTPLQNPSWNVGWEAIVGSARTMIFRGSKHALPLIARPQHDAGRMHPKVPLQPVATRRESATAERHASSGRAAASALAPSEAVVSYAQCVVAGKTPGLPAKMAGTAITPCDSSAFPGFEI